MSDQEMNEHEQGFHDFLKERGVPTQPDIQEQFDRFNDLGVGLDKDVIGTFCAYSFSAYDLFFEGFIQSYDGQSRVLTELCEYLREIRKGIRTALHDEEFPSDIDILLDWMEDGGVVHGDDEEEVAISSIALINALYDHYSEIIGVFDKAYRKGDDVHPRFYIGSAFLHYTMEMLGDCGCQASVSFREHGAWTDLEILDDRIAKIAADINAMGSAEKVQAVRTAEESSGMGLTEILDDMEIHVN